MTGVVRMAIFKLRDKCIKCIEKVEIRAGIQVGDRQRSGRMQHKKVADPRRRLLLRELLPAAFRKINNFLFPLSGDAKDHHNTVVSRKSSPVLASIMSQKFFTAVRLSLVIAAEAESRFLHGFPGFRVALATASLPEMTRSVSTTYATAPS